MELVISKDELWEKLDSLEIGDNSYNIIKDFLEDLDYKKI